MNDKLMVVRRYRLKTLSPLFIGSGEKLNSLEFIVIGGKLYVVDDEKLGKVLRDKGLLRNFIDYMKNSVSDGRGPRNQRGRGRNYPPLSSFLQQYRCFNDGFAKSVSKYVISSKRTPRELNLCVKDSYNRVYLPGSSIKGALRTAILYVLLKKTPSARAELNDYVRMKLSEAISRESNRQSFKRTFAKEFEEKIFQFFNLTGTDKYDPHTDVLRVIRVSDSNRIFLQKVLQVSEVKVASLGNGLKPFSIYVETIKPNTSFDFTVSIDLDLWNRFKQKSRSLIPTGVLEKVILDPVEAAREMAQDLFEHEKKAILRKFRVDGSVIPADIMSISETPDMRMSWGSGLLGITVDLLLDEELRKRIRNELFVYKGGAPAPKSRKLDATNRYVELGWVKITQI